MKLNTRVALLMLVIGCLAVFIWKYAAPILERRSQISTSDAVKTKGIINIGVDNFLGYYILCSPYQRSQMRNAGYELQCIDDDAAYGKRMELLRDGKIQFAVATVDSYELNAIKAKFPGLIVMVIDRSKGADGAIACNSKVKNVDDLKRGGVKIAFAEGTPSEYFMKILAVDFDITQWRGKDTSWRKPVKSSIEAAKMCNSGETDVAFMWEPDLTRTLVENPNAVKIIGTEVAPRAIVDVLMVQREYAKSNPEAVITLLSNYFRSLYYYINNTDVAATHAAEYAKIDRKYIGDAMKGIAWVNLTENAALWLGITEQPGQQAQFGLIEVIENTMRILIEHGTDIPLPGGNPRSIVWSEPIEQLFRSGLANSDKVDPNSGDTMSREFSELTEEQWNTMRPIGTHRARSIIFSSGVDTLSRAAKENIDRIAETIKGYPDFRIVLEGHTSARGDAVRNLTLSRDRVEAVARYFMVTYGVKQNRIRIVGYGGSRPLARVLDETEKEYQSRLPRVVVKLVTEAY
ncbi:MAG: phosphate ABC transporter substrate-binding/OmpA family protein [Patescibacteria group bacterium]